MSLLLLKFTLDEYTSWWNSPQAAIYFWSAFLLFVVLVVAVLAVWIARTRSAK
jgi:hypothetical protein